MKNISIPEKLIEQYLETGILAIGEYHGVKENYIFYETLINSLPEIPNLAIEMKETERIEFEKFLKGDKIDPSILSASLEPVDVRHPIASAKHCPVYYVEANNYSKIVQPYQGPELKELKRFVTNYLGGKFIKQTVLSPI